MLWVREDLRGQRIGSRLLAEAEQAGRELGARNAALETFERQAPAFYAKNGYREAARLDDYYLAVMRKRL
ncbi:GNAT family N-acetyltransferase [Sorangium sp. So ce128]|uniref:GNAT family N-acetyltransferase n=1 Tax=Sorangium sp. So ce128 TaxID=3133281 RepID=UPI003F5F67A1